MQTEGNPWLDIPAEEYEAHMALPAVSQLQALNTVFADMLRKAVPERLLVLGAGTGNGFEHIDTAVTRHVTALDINPRYLDVLQLRHGGRIGGLRCLPCDAQSADLEAGAHDRIFAALFFEYVDVGAMLTRISQWLAPGGVLTAVLQLPSVIAEAVSETPYASIERLAGLMHLVDPALFTRQAETAGLARVSEARVPLPRGKAFYVADYRRVPS